MRVIIRTIRHDDLCAADLTAIAALKAQFWQYPVQSQIKWMEAHFAPSDTHLLLYQDDALIAYSGLSRVFCRVNGEEKVLTGLGNVCVHKDFQKLGYGKTIVDHATKTIIDSGKAGILLCHAALVPFYAGCGWNRCDMMHTVVEGETYRHCVMTVNEPSHAAIAQLQIDRNF